MSLTCHEPWHFLRNDDESITWFRWLRPFGSSNIHYRFGPVPEDAHTRRIYDFGEGRPWTCAGCGRIIDGIKPPKWVAAAAPPEDWLPPAFDGFPYLVTRIGHTDLRNVAILPAAWPRQRLVDLARRQAAANQLETCVCIGPADAVYVNPDGTTREDSHLPTGMPVDEGLVLADPISDTAEVRARRARLVAFRESLHPEGYLVGDGLEGGRPATAEDITRLSVSVPGSFGRPMPAGLRRCRTCRLLAGDFLAVHGEGNGDRTPRVIPIHCRCDNHNRCARCGEPLARRRLSAYEYDEVEEKAMYLAAYAAFNHRCPRQLREGSARKG